MSTKRVSIVAFIVFSKWVGFVIFRVGWYIKCVNARARACVCVFI